MTPKPAVGTVFVVDDDEAVRDSLTALLEAKAYTVKSYASGEAFLTSYAPDQHGCALVDLRMPRMDGLALIAQLQARGARLPVVVVTGHGDIPLAVQAMKAGAVDFIEKPYTSERILDAVRQALARSGAGEPAGAEAANALRRLASLTRREREVLDRLVVGQPNKVIAHELEISPRTVEIHRANLMKKMEAQSLSHLVRLALSAGLGAQPS
jgi:two-component system, LuxR family, response regulator FixJ